MKKINLFQAIVIALLLLNFLMILSVYSKVSVDITVDGQKKRIGVNNFLVGIYNILQNGN
jgi:hypothetical protein